MKRLAYFAAVAAAAVSLTACMDMGHHHGGPYAGAYVDGYYDDAYGPVYDGYWGDGDAFYYRGSADGEFRRDDAHHFSRATGNGFHPMHMRAGQAPHGAQSPRAG
jgi:hypothetical protein